MPFSHGSKAKVLLNGYDVSQYLQSAGVAESVDTAEVSGLGRASKVYIPGLADATVALEGAFHGAAESADAVLRLTLGQANGDILTHLIQGDALGLPCLCAVGITTALEVSTPIGDKAGITASIQASGGAEATKILHTLSNESADGDGPDLDNTVLSANGGVAYLHVTALTASALDLTVDHAAVATYAPLITFPTITAVGAYRMEVAGNVQRHARAHFDLTGGAATFHLAFGRK
jgi:hypothetical protein